MQLRALLLCDDVRLEVGGTFTAVGIRGTHLEVPAGEGIIVFPKMAVLTIVSDVRGVTWLGCRQTLILPGGRARSLAPDERHAHDPLADEHHFLVIVSPMELAGRGRYAIRVELECEHGTLELSHAFELVSTPSTPTIRLEAEPST